jgi:hypothetical protein
MATIDISRNDDDRTVAFAAQPTPGYAAGRLARELGLRTDVPFAEVGAEVARLLGAGHAVVCGAGAARKLAAAGADVSRTLRPT